MAHEKAIAQALDSLWGKSSERNLIRGRLGLPGGGSPIFDVPDKPGYKYVNKGAAGEQGQVIARDLIGVANTYNQSVWMRYEFGEYVIGRADVVAGGSGGGGASNLNALTDVTLTTPANGNVLSYNSATSQWINVVPAGGAGGAPSPHAHSSVHHTGLLPWAELNKSGSSLNEIATRPHGMLTGIAPDDHHNQQHVLATGTALGGDHTISGAVAGEVLRALSATTAAFDVLQHTDLGNIQPDQHHPFVHDIIANVAGFGVAHTVTGADYTVVGVHPANTLSLLPTSSAPGAAISILRTDANGGIQLDTNLLYVDGANNRIGVNLVPGAGPLGGAAALDIRAAATGDITQRIRQIAGQTQRLWRVEDTTGNELIVMDSVGNLQSGNPGFVSGLLGWQITYNGNAEFNNIWARGELHATVFVKDEVHATGGTFFVATAGTLHDDAVISSATVDDDVLTVYSTPAGQGVPLQVVTTSGTFVGTELHVSWVGNFINVNDPPSGPGTIGGPGPYFQSGDIVRSKTEVPTGVTDFWLEVNGSIQTANGYATYSVFKRSGTDGTLPKGAALVSYGKEGDGRILMTSDLNYAPYIDVFTTGTNVWLQTAGSVIPRMRMGRLDGIGLPGVSGVTQYGMIAGKDLSDANSGYLIASNLQFSLYKINIRLNNGSNDTGLWTPDGNLFLGTNIGGDPLNSPMLATTGFRVYTTGGTGASPGDVIIGSESTDNYLKWSQVSGLLTVHGQLTVSGGGGAVTSTYVDGKDQEYDAKANLSPTGYAGIAQTNSQTYADARRIVGVTGSWDSPTATTIRWGVKAVAGTPPSVPMSAAFGNNTNRTIAEHAAPSISVTSRMYLFVNVSGTGTMTMTATAFLGTVMASVNNVLVAVADPGDASTKSCSITIVAGSTYISGSNIFTGSIVAANIAAGTITADKLVASSITSTYLDPGVNTSISSAQSTANTANTTANTANTTANTANTAAGNAQTTANAANSKAQQGIDDAAAAVTYGDNRRVLGVSGTWTVIDGLTINWQTVSIQFANGAARAITNSPGNYTFASVGRWYMFVDMTQGTLTMIGSGSPSTLFSAMTLNDVLIAVVDTYANPGKASINMVAGSTYISGGNIVTQSIRSTEIAADAIIAGKIDALAITSRELAAGSVTATKISVGTLSAVSTSTGALNVTGNIDIGVTGAIRGNAKAYGDGGGSGFFLGYSSPYYRFDVGDDDNYLRWTGTQLLLKTEWALEMGTDNFGQAINITNPVTHRVGHIAYDNAGSNSFVFTDRVEATSFRTVSGTIEGLQLRAVLPSAAGGIVIWLEAGGSGDSFNYSRSSGSGVLSYSGQMTVNGAFTASGQLTTNGNNIRISTTSSPANSGAAGSVGEIRWDDGYMYIRNSNGWRRIPTGNAF